MNSHKKIKIKISNRLIGEDFKPLIIAELGINHGGSLIQAKKLVDAAQKAGAEIIKHQTHVVEDEMTEEAKKIIPQHTKVNIFNIIENCSLSEKDEKNLMDYVKKKGMIFISTPFSKLAVDRLIKFNVPAFKIGSGECNNYPLIEYIAKFKKPIILSTGMNSIETIKPSVKILRKYKVPFALLHCTNIYPTPSNLIRLDAINLLRAEFPDAVIGLSDHSQTIYPCLGAVALGASIIEKHFTDSKKRKGPDISASVDKKEFKILKFGINEIFNARGGKKIPLKQEKSTMNFAFACVAATKSILKGEKLSKKNTFPRRPGIGDYFARDYYKILGKIANKDIKKNTLIKKIDIK
jgi:N-acetylneuraminate synthase